jgi:uncharacterized protein (TIGR03437 family)
MTTLSLSHRIYDSRSQSLVKSAIFVLGAILIPCVSAAPAITTIANAAGNIGFNSPIAPGSIFIIKGTGLGPANLTIDPKPFQNTTLGGTSIAVTVGATTVNALMYYTSATQVAALLPSNTPTTAGGNFTVTYNGQASGAVGHGLASSNVGVFSVDSSGQGPGIVTFPDYSLLSPTKASNCGGVYTTCGAANPGDTLIIWATGMGAAAGNDDTTGGLGKPINAPLTLWLGGVQAPVSYQGRSGCCVGEDQIVFTVPPNAPTGCAVPLAIQIGTTGNTVSNTTVIPIANGSRSCTPNSPALAAVGSDNIQQAVAAGPITFGSIALNHTLQTGNNAPTFLDHGDFTFAKIVDYAPGTQPFFTSFVDSPPLGTCMVIPDPNGAGTSPIGNFAPLDAGASFTVKGPNGTVPVAGNPGEFKPVFSASGTFLVSGAYTITSNGGNDVGPINATLTIPATPTYLSPNPNGLSITRSSGLTVTWNPNGSAGHVEIQLASALDNTFNTGSLAACTAPASAGTFTIPPYVLLALPANNFTYLFFGTGGAWPAAENGFSAKGLSVGLLQAFADGSFFGGFPIK